MRRATLNFILFSFFSLAFIPGDVHGSACSNSLYPPFIASNVKPNILIILDNSQSMDEDFYGNAVGSYGSTSKSVVARQALQNMVTELQNQANVGIMTFGLPSDTSNNWFVHNAMPFASYNPKSYCPNPPSDCVTYCTTGDSTAKANCEAACPGLTTTTYDTGTDFPDAILSTAVYPFTSNLSGTRAKYCGLAYPKTQRWLNPTDPSGNYVYYNQTDPFYDTSSWGIQFGYSGHYSAYSTAENAANYYTYCFQKTGTSDLWNGYSGSCTNHQFQPTDSDWALGFYNWGQRMPLYYVGPTWFSPSGGSPSPQGYLHLPVTPLSGTTCFNSSGVSNGQTCSTKSDCTAPYNSSCSANSGNYNNLISLLNPNANNSAGYMSCTQTGSSSNKCPYIINATNTPTAGTLNSALAYFNGQYQNGGVKYASPISSQCQKNYIIFVTDGLPSTLMNGTQTQTISQLMTEVTTQLSDLQTNVSQTINGTAKIYPVPTYVLGLGLTPQAKTNLDQMAVAGGTATTTGHAYYADQPEDLTTALETIMVNLLGQVSSGSAISILSEGQTQNGANMLQGVFYPAKYFGTTAISYPGYLYNYWYYTSTQYNNIREDTVHDYILELDQDYGLSFLFDPQAGLSVDRYSDPNGSGNPNVFVNNVGLDALSPIWEAGKMLLQTTAGSRQILTPGTNSNGSGLVSFDTSNTTLTTPASSPLGNPALIPSTFDSCLQPPGTSNTAILQNLITYVRGTDITNNFCSNGTTFNNTACNSNSDCKTAPYTTCATLSSCRNRTVGLCSNGTACNSDPDCTSGSCTKNVWKMGDIVYSTPQVQTDYLYCFNGSSFSTQSCTKDSDCTTGTYTTCQKKQSVVFVGANDGMLHAFETGVISTTGLDSSKHQVAELTGIPTSSMGQELWGFIPTNSLPYLRCLASPSGCHLYYNDLSPYITTMNQQYCSNATSQSCTQDSDCGSGTCTTMARTVLIGGMRLGGAAISTVNYCLNSSGQTASPPQTCSQNSDCTTTPYNKSCSSPYYYINAPSDTCSAWAPPR